ASLAGDVPLPFRTEVGMRVENQARFHPVLYVNGLASALEGGGCGIYDRTRVVDFKEGSPCVVTTDAGFTVTATDVVFATHTPLGISPLHTTLTPLRSFILVAEVDNPPGDALYWDTEDPYHYIRLLNDDGLIMVGGKDRKTG